MAGLIEAGIGGKPVSNAFLGARVYDISVRYELAARSNPEALGNLAILSSTGARIPLAAAFGPYFSNETGAFDAEPPCHRLSQKGNAYGFVAFGIFDAVLGGSWKGL